jgi:hypothetical protein
MTSATSSGLPEPITIWVQETCMVQHWGARLLDHPDSRITMVRLGNGADRPSMESRVIPVIKWLVTHGYKALPEPDPSFPSNHLRLREITFVRRETGREWCGACGFFHPAPVHGPMPAQRDHDDPLGDRKRRRRLLAMAQGQGWRL